MSYAQLVPFFDHEAGHCDYEYKNAHGVGPIVWSYLIKKYASHFPVFQHETAMWDELFKLYDSGALKLEVPEQWVFQFVSMSKALIHKDMIEAFAEALEDIGVKAKAEFPTYVNHLEEMAKNIRELKEEGVFAVGLYPHSVGDNAWTVYEYDEDTEEEEYRSYNLLLDKGHYFLGMPDVDMSELITLNRSERHQLYTIAWQGVHTKKTWIDEDALEGLISKGLVMIHEDHPEAAAGEISYEATELGRSSLSEYARTACQRPLDYTKRSLEEQWAIDKTLGILDWNGL